MSELKAGARLLFALALFTLALATHVRAQDSASSTNAPQTPASASNDAATDEPTPSGEAYRIGTGDVLEVIVTTGSGRSPQLSAESLQVNEKGLIQVFDGEMSAACLTMGELASALKTRYLQYKREPLSVVVNVKEYRSQLVAVIGAVKAPGRFELRRPIRLLELLALYAGGPSEGSDGRIEIVHTQNSICTGPDARAELAMTSVSFKWDDTRLGKDEANPYVRPGDVVSLADAPQAFVTGNVREPKNILLKERVTLTTALAMAGGTLDATKSDKIRIQRRKPGGTSMDVLIVNLDAIKKLQIADVELMPGDIVDVPASKPGKILNGLLNSVVPITTQGTVRVIR
jgi:polysaccharide export outer membrane protein